MTEIGIIQKRLIEKFCRMDATFLIIATKHEALIDELLATFTQEELSDIARKMPFDGDAAELVWGHINTKVKLDRHLGLIKMTPYASSNVACYVALVSQYLVSKMLTEVERLTEEKLRVIRTLKDLMKMAHGKSPLLFASMKKEDYNGGTVNTEEAQDGGSAAQAEHVSDPEA